MTNQRVRDTLGEQTRTKCAWAKPALTNLSAQSAQFGALSNPDGSGGS